MKYNIPQFIIIYYNHQTLQRKPTIICFLSLIHTDESVPIIAACFHSPSQSEWWSSWTSLSMAGFHGKIHSLSYGTGLVIGQFLIEKEEISHERDTAGWSSPPITGQGGGRGGDGCTQAILPPSSVLGSCKDVGRQYDLPPPCMPCGHPNFSRWVGSGCTS